MYKAAFCIVLLSSISPQGPFQGLTGHWTLTGTAVTAVPEAETSALMLAGLGAVGFAARRRREVDLAQSTRRREKANY